MKRHGASYGPFWRPLLFCGVTAHNRIEKQMTTRHTIKIDFYGDGPFLQKGASSTPRLLCRRGPSP